MDYLAAALLIILFAISLRLNSFLLRVIGVVLTFLAASAVAWFFCSPASPYNAIPGGSASVSDGGGMSTVVLFSLLALAALVIIAHIILKGRAANEVRIEILWKRAEQYKTGVKPRLKLERRIIAIGQDRLGMRHRSARGIAKALGYVETKPKRPRVKKPAEPKNVVYPEQWKEAA